MAGPSWLVDSNRIATKIKSASGACDPGRVNWKSNPTKACPKCQYVVDNSDVTQEWPGLPRGVKFDPSDQEIILHLLAKAGVENLTPHPFIDEFIPTIENDDGICYTHPENLPGVKQDGSVSHFFHRAIKAYNTGTRKRRKIHGVDLGDVRWHKTGRTKPVILDANQKGCKKIMVLYESLVRGGKPEKTNWVMHQYHLGTLEDEHEGEYVISKVFYQQQQVKQSEQSEEHLPECIDATIAKVDPVTPKSVTPEPPRADRRFSDFDPGQGSTIAFIGTSAQDGEMKCVEDEVEAAFENPQDKHGEMECIEDEVEAAFENPQDHLKAENHADQMGDNNDNQAGEDPKWWDSESQYLLDSQQLVEGLSLCDEFFQSQSPNRDESENRESKGKPRLSDYARLGPEDLKKDLAECQNLVLDSDNLELDTSSEFRLSQLVSENRESKDKPHLFDYTRLGPEDLKKDLAECQNLVLDPANLELDTPPDFRLSQLEFGSQESFLAWGGSQGA